MKKAVAAEITAIKSIKIWGKSLLVKILIITLRRSKTLRKTSLRIFAICGLSHIPICAHICTDHVEMTVRVHKVIEGQWSVSNPEVSFHEYLLV